jgi:hypothetical protein
VPEFPLIRLGELIRNAGTSSRCNLSSDADPEVSPSLDAPATICHPFGVGKLRISFLIVERQDSISKIPLQLIRLYQVVAVGWGCDGKLNESKVEGQPEPRAERDPRTKFD